MALTGHATTRHTSLYAGNRTWSPDRTQQVTAPGPWVERLAGGDRTRALAGTPTDAGAAELQRLATGLHQRSRPERNDWPAPHLLARTAGVGALPVWFVATTVRPSRDAVLLRPKRSLGRSPDPASSTLRHRPPGLRTRCSNDFRRDTSQRRSSRARVHHSVADYQAAPPAPRRRPSRAARSATERSRRTPRLSKRRNGWRPPLQRIRAMLSPWEPDTRCCWTSVSAAIFTHTWCRIRANARCPASACDRQRAAMRAHAEPHTVAREVKRPLPRHRSPRSRCCSPKALGHRRRGCGTGHSRRRAAPDRRSAAPRLLMAADPTSEHRHWASPEPRAEAHR